MVRSIAALVLFVAAILAPSMVLADAIVVTKAMTASTIAEIFISEDAIRVELEIGGPDLKGFRNLMPDGVYERMGFEPEPFVDRLVRFFGEDLVFRLDDGPPIPGRILEMEPRKRVVRDEITGEPLPVPEGEGEDVIFAVLEYPLTGTTGDDRHDATGSPAGHVGGQHRHDDLPRDLPVNDFRYFGTEEILDLDWSDPWYSKFRNRNLRRQYDSPINAFLYVEPYEVRVEIIVRPVDMEQWMDLGLEGRKTIPVEMQYELQTQIAEFLAEHLNLTIDGEPVAPEFDRVNFLRRTLRTSTVITPPEELDVVSATLGVIYVAPTEGLPQEASITWDLFTDRIQRIPAAATDEAGPLRFFLVPDDNVLWWKNFLKNPTMPTLLEIVPPPSLGVRLAGWVGWGALAVLAVMLLRVGVDLMKGRGLAKRGLAALLILLLVAGSSLAVALPNRLTDEQIRGDRRRPATQRLPGLRLSRRGEHLRCPGPECLRRPSDRDLPRDSARTGAGQPGWCPGQGQGDRNAGSRAAPGAR